MASRYHLAVCAALALGTTASYWQTFDSQFVSFDDPLYVTANPFVQRGLSRESVHWAFTTTDLANWHPLTWLSLQLDYELFGLDPAGFHATNLFLHVMNVLVVYWLFWRCTNEMVCSAFVAAFFGVHPLHVESVAWISERKDVLSTFLLLLSMIAWVTYARRKRLLAYFLSFSCYVLSLMAKPMGVTLPLLLLLFDEWPLKHDAQSRGGLRVAGQRRLLVVEKLPFFLASAASAAISLWAQRQGGALDFGLRLPWSYRLGLVPVNYLTYLRQTLLPINLAAFYRHPGTSLPLWKPLAATSVLCSISIAVWRQRTSRPYLVVGWLWFLISLLPVIGIVQIGGHATADRYMYLPMLGLLIVACWGIRETAIAWRAYASLSLVATLCLVVCVMLTYNQVKMWHDDTSLFTPLTKR